MANRVTHTDVTKIVETSIEDTTPFIDIANAVVDDRLKGEGLGSSLLTQIEKLLAAHFILLKEEHGGLVRERLGEATNEYRGIAGQELLSTRYGEQAVALDRTGKLKEGGRKKARFTVMPRDTDTRSGQ